MNYGDDHWQSVEAERERRVVLDLRRRQLLREANEARRARIETGAAPTPVTWRLRNWTGTALVAAGRRLQVGAGEPGDSTSGAAVGA